MAYRGSYTTASGKSVRALLDQFGEAAVADLGAELYEEAWGIVTQAQDLTPVDTGTLRASAFAAEPKREGNVLRVELGFGGPAAKINPKTGQSSDSYALFVHENLEAHHPVGQALYLEQPFKWAKKGMSERLAEALRRRSFNRYGGTMAQAMGEADGVA